MKFDALAYPDTFEIGGIPYKGRRNRETSEVMIPYSEAPTVNIGDQLLQRSGPSAIQLKVVDVSYLENGSLKVGTKHPHILTLAVENLTSSEHRLPQNPTAIHIGSISGQQVQVGNQNTQITNITLTEVLQKVAASNDVEAKNLLSKLLQNNTVAAIVGAGTTALLGVLGA